MGRYIVGLLAVFILGLVLGSDAKYEPAQVVDTRDVPVQIVKEIETPALIGTCFDVVEAARSMQEATSTLSAAKGELNAILGDAQKAIADSDFKLLGLQEAKLKTLTETVTETEVAVQAHRERMDTALAECGQGE